MKTNASTGLLIGLFRFTAPAAFTQATITVNAAKPGQAIPPTLWGIFFEDIDLSADGGLNPELVRNRSCEDASQPVDWSLTNGADGHSTMSVDSS